MSNQRNGKTVFTAEDCQKQLAAMRTQQDQNDRKMAIIIEKLENVAEKLASLPCLTNLEKKG